MVSSANPLVSVILPTYNRASVLPLAIHSVLGQSYPNWELIVVNDNSPDDTDQVMLSFTDRRIRYFKNNPNLKLPRTLNRGFLLAKGHYLTWTSDDNMLASDALARMVAELETGDADFVFTDYYEFADADADGNPISAQAVHLPGEPNLARGNTIGACFLYTRDVYEKIGEYDPSLFLNEDYDYWMRVARHFRLRHIPELLYYFRRDENSLYCSRFSEVRAGSLLVRYKNRYIQMEGVLTGMADLIMVNLDHHHNALVRSGFLSAKRISFKLTRLYERVMRRLISTRLRKEVFHILMGFDEGRLNFNEARLGLRDLMNQAALIEYRGYVRAGNA